MVIFNSFLYVYQRVPLVVALRFHRETTTHKLGRSPWCRRLNLRLPGSLEMGKVQDGNVSTDGFWWEKWVKSKNQHEMSHLNCLVKRILGYREKTSPSISLQFPWRPFQELREQLIFGIRSSSGYVDRSGRVSLCWGDGNLLMNPAG